ncbi:MAG: stage II sporulation protein M [Natronomonas sp.]
MDISAAVTTAITTLRRRPADLLPLYVLGAAVPVVARAVVAFGFVVSYLYLEVTGRLDALREAVVAGDVQPPDPDAGEEELLAWSEEVLPLLEPLASPVVWAATVGGLAAAFVLFVVLYFAVAGGRISACDARLRDEAGVAAGLVGGKRYWASFLGLFIFEAILWIGLLTIGSLVVGLATLAGPIGVVVGVLVAPVVVAALAVVRLVFVFAPVAVVVDERSAFDGVRAGLGFLRTQTVQAVMYALLAVLLLSGLAGIGVGLSLVGAGTVVGLLGLLVVTPFLDLLKTGLYADFRESIDPPEPPERSYGTQFLDGLGRGWREMVGFVRETPLAHGIATAALLVGFASGWLFVGPFVGLTETSIAERVDELVFGVAALEFFANNWTVTLTLGFSGLGFAAPAVVSLWFNGLVFGIVGRLEVDPIELVAFVVPHGIFEIPAVLIAGAVGLRLGVVGWRAARGRIGTGDVAGALHRAFWILVGVGVLLAVAGFIEGVISPYYYQPFL